MLRAPVNKILPMSLVDGPGNRCAVFFQGCNFNCTFCHNPETINMCNHCGECVKACHFDALSIVDGKVIYNKVNCTDCDACINVCRFEASPKIVGYTPDDLVTEIKPYIPFIQGITTSGGECTIYADFLADFFTKTKDLGLTNFVDTNGGILLNDPKFERFVDKADAFMLDIKAFNSDEHIKLTRTDNKNVLNNLKYLAERQKLYEVRTVLIEGYDNQLTVKSVGDILKPHLPEQSIRYKLIKYRHYGVRAEYQTQRAISDDEIASLELLARHSGFREVIII